MPGDCVLRNTFKRQVDGGRRWTRQHRKDRLAKIEFNQNKVIKSVHDGGLTWFDLDPVEHRYLLAGAADSSVAAYDVQQPAAVDHLSGTSECRAVFSIDRRHAGGHKYSVSAVAWYPVDTGLFVTGGFDKTAKVWDTNAQQPVVEFKLSDKVYALALSPIATTHCLVAVGSGEPAVRLGDPRSGGFTHSLAGHRDAVWAAAWSLTCEFQLATGSMDGQVRLWDIRRAGVVHVFDHHQTAAPPHGSSGGAGGAARGAKRGRGGGAEAGGGGSGSGGGRQGRGASSRSTAHSGFVTAVHPTSDGLFWVTAGTDARVRLWDTKDHRNTLVNYPGTFNSAMKARQIATSDDRACLFHPSGSVVQVFDLMSGKQVKLLRGAHFETINALAYNPATQELYTGANDCNIVVWSAPDAAPVAEGAAGGSGRGPEADQDNWSD